jgi:RIO kinase 2
MKLDPTVMRTMSPQDFRVMEAVEEGMKKHALVPSPLIASISALRHGGTGKIISSLLRDKLLSHDQSCGYDGYRLTNAGYDILALHNLKSRKFIAAIGDRIGTGKESDIYLAVHPNGTQVVLKLHRLGRTSFRNVKKTRDYFVYHNKGRGGSGGGGGSVPNTSDSWLFLSRQSALKEYAFMKALHDVDYPTPEPIAHNRHIVVMSLIRGVPLYQVSSRNLSSEQAASIFHQASDLALRLAKHGLVHCDLNEFNLIVDLSGIQQKALSQEHDPYVRHSGMSVAAESNPGMLSARGPWEPEHLQKFQPGHVEEDVGSKHSDDQPPAPAELLDNGEAKPIVTLIDFPQMVSTQHPNAKELYERDTACLYKFFTHKLQFRIPESEQANLFLSWESVQGVLEEERLKQKENALSLILTDDQTAEENGDGPDGGVDNSSQSVCLASKAQLRLDHELKASGYSEADTSRDMELHYYYTHESRNRETVGKSHADAILEHEDFGTTDNDGDAINNDDDEEGNDDDGSIESNEQDTRGEDVSVAPSIVTNASILALPAGQLTEMTRQQLQGLAKERVRQQLDGDKKKHRQQGAFRKRNTNKSYIKGKRVFNDLGM